MGSLDRYCRLCAQAVRPDQLQPLYCGDPGHTTESQAAGRLRSFLGFAVAAGDRLPKQVCQPCLAALDYCVGWVDRCRRVESLLQVL